MAPTAGLVGALVVLSGLAGTPALTARAAGVQQLLPEHAWAAGFSGLYAAGVRFAMLACVALAAVATVVGAAAEARIRPAR